MSCLIPLSELARLGQYGIKKHKPYNDANKGVIEKYGLTIEENEVYGKSIVIENDEDYQKFFKYFVEELLGRGEVAGTKIVQEGVPLEKYEEKMKEIISLRETLAGIRKELEITKEEKDHLSFDVSQLQRKIKELEETIKKKNVLVETLQAKLKDVERRKKIERVKKLLEKKLSQEEIKEILSLFDEVEEKND